MPTPRRKAPKPRRKAPGYDISEEQSPFLSQEDPAGPDGASFLARRRSIDAHQNRFSLQDMEYPTTNIPLDSHPLLDEAILSSPTFLQQEMGVALGLKSGQPSWLPSAHEDDVSEPEDGENYYKRASVQYPDASRRGRFSHIYSRRDSTQGQDTDLTYEIPMITLNTSNLPSSRENTKDANAPDLESGLFHPPATPISREFPMNPVSRIPPGSPSRFSGFITRITDRIAGTDHPQTPTTERNASSFWGNEQIDNSTRPSSVIEVLPSSPINETINASSTSIMSPSSPFMVPHESSRHSSMESIHSFEPQGSIRAHRPSTINSGLSPISSSLGRTSYTSEGSSNRSAIAPRTSSKSQGTKNNMDSPHNPCIHGKSLGTFSPKSRFRNWCHKIICNKLTNLAVTIIIIAQTAVLARRQWNPPAYHGYFFHGYSPGDYTLIVINLLIHSPK
ncbi:hypothetical protein JCM33374_g6561 [Metschnikowia sp. JCM 33374]|nr:hypothetical protein JCM33374_g6561 [Metschnikowia sp. JCM 33374]